MYNPPSRLSTPLNGRGQLSSPRSVWTQVQPERRSCFYFSAWENSSAVLCVHNTAELFVSGIVFV